MHQKGYRSDYLKPGQTAYNKETTRDEQWQVIVLREQTKPQMSWTAISVATGLEPSTCRMIYRRWKTSKDSLDLGPYSSPRKSPKSRAKHQSNSRAWPSPSNRKRSGRPPLFLQPEKRRLERFVTMNKSTRRMRWEEIQNSMGYQCSPTLVKKAMASLGYHKRVPRRKFAVTPVNQKKRVQWALEHLTWTYEEWKRVLWTDESSFSTAGFHHRRMVIRKPGEEYHADCIDEKAESGKKTVMVWGAFCGHVKSDLVFIPSKVTIDSASYVMLVMEPHLIPFWHRMCEKYGWTVVVEDNAPGHKGYSKKYRLLNDMEAMVWPPQSPDVNLMEPLWADMECKLGERWGRVGNLETLKDCIGVVWDEILESR